MLYLDEVLGYKGGEEIEDEEEEEAGENDRWMDI